MRRVLLRFPIVVYPSEQADIGGFTAHCLNLDIIADDESLEGAVTKLLDTIEAQLDAADENGVDPIQLAPRRYWEMLGRAKQIPSELVERVIRTANKRHGVRDPSGAIDAGQLEIREFQAA